MGALLGRGAEPHRGGPAAAGTLDDRIRQSYAHLAQIQQRSKSPSGTSLGERIIGDAAGRYDALQELRRAVYGSSLPEPS